MANEATKATNVKPKKEGNTCWKCKGTGLFYGRGYVENGVFKGSTGPCYQCQGTGIESAADKRRCDNYWAYHARAF